MTAVKVSISVPEELLHEARRWAEEHATTLSALVTESLAARLRIEAGLAGVAEYEAENGPLPEELLAEARAALGVSRGRRTRAKSTAR
jgi:hypothetical protein